MRRDSLVLVACACLPVWACGEETPDRSGCNYFGHWRVSLDVAEVLGPEAWHLRVSGSPGNENIALTADGLSCDSGGTTNPWTCAISASAVCKPLVSEFDIGDLWTVDLTFTQTDGAWTGTGRWRVESQGADDIASFGDATATK